MRVLFAGTPTFAKIQLDALIESQHDVVAVYTQPDKPAGRGQKSHESEVKTRAKALGLPVLQPANLRDDDTFFEMQQFQPDVILVAAYGLLLPKRVLALPPLGCINVHASLLPRWRGASPIQHAILSGDLQTGVTLMRMNEGLDTGAILAQKSCPILETDTAQSLHDTLAKLGHFLVCEQFERVAHEAGTPQADALATHAPKIDKNDAKMKWEEDAASLARKVRAFHPWPIAFTDIGDIRLRIFESKVMPLTVNAAPGTLLCADETGLTVATGAGSLCITVAQLPGKKAMPVKDILRGHAHLFQPNARFA